MTEMNHRPVLTRADIDVLNGSINRQVRSDPMDDTMVKIIYKVWLWQNNAANAELRGISKPAWDAGPIIPE